MANLRKKLKLISVLKKIEGKSFSEGPIVDELITKIEKMESSPSPYMTEIEVIKKKQDIINSSLEVLAKDVENKEKVIFDLVTLISESKEKGNISLKTISEYRKELDDIKIHIQSLHNRGGGSMNQKISVNGVWATTRYADFNLIAGSNMTISVSNNDTYKRTDITFVSTGSTPVTAAMAVETPSGTIDGSNTTFTVLNTPLWIVLNQVTYYENDGYTLSGLTVTMLVTPMAGSTLRSVYQTGVVAAVETPSGTINGVNAAFTVANTPLWLTINGATYFENNGYTLSGLNVTIDPTVIPLTNSVLRSVYKASTTAVTSETPSGAINGVNTTYTVSTTPLWIVLGQGTLFVNDGYTLSVLTVSMLVTPLTGEVLRSIY